MNKETIIKGIVVLVFGAAAAFGLWYKFADKPPEIRTPTEQTQQVNPQHQNIPLAPQPPSPADDMRNFTIPTK